MRLKLALVASCAALAFAAGADAQVVRKATPQIGYSSLISQINGPVMLGSTLIQHGGWSARWGVGAPPTTLQASPIPILVYRQGFDINFNATTYVDTIYLQTNLRTAGPPYTAPPMTADTLNVGLSRTLYTTDSIPGVPNLTDETAPPPTCNWEMPGRRLITTGTITASMFCGGIDARQNGQIRGIRFTITDGTNSDTCDATAMADDGLFTNDRIKSDFFSCVLSTTNLSAGVKLTLNAKDYPWLGSVAAGSVWDTSTVTTAQSPSGSVERQASPRYYIKDTVRTGAPVALVCPTAGTYPSGTCGAAGSDTTGSWATGLSASLPFATEAGAINAITNATRGKPFTAMSGCANGCADGAVIELSQAANNTFAAPTSNVPQLIAALEITSDTGGSGKATLTYSSAFSPKMGIGTSLIPTSAEGTLWLESINYTRTANVTITGGASNNLELQFTNSVIDLGSASSAALCSNCGTRIYASTINNYDGGLQETGTLEARNWRGVHLASIAAAAPALPAWNMVGNEFDGTSGHVLTLSSLRAESGSILYNNIVHFPSASSDTVAFGKGGSNAPYEISGLAIVQNLIEINNNASNVSIGLSRDCDTGTFSGTIKNAAIQYNVVTGNGSNGRPNVGYDTCSNPPGQTTPTETYRPHHLWDVRGNAWGATVYIKVEWFSYANNIDHTAGQFHIGGWPIMFGAGAQGNLQRFCDVVDGCYGGDRNLFYTGRRSINGTADSTETVANPLWTDDKGIQIGGASGAGYGDYHIGALSPCKGIVDFAALAHGIYGGVRPPTNDSCGVEP